jgi:hypothetical protein
VTPSHQSPSVPRRPRLPHKKKLAAALALSTITGLAYLAQAETASAEVLGGVVLTVKRADMNNWSAGWSAAYDQCGKWYPGTKSVKFLGGQESNDPATAFQYWECHDTEKP